MNIIVFAMFLWLTALLIFEIVFLMQAINYSANVALRGRYLKMIHPCYQRVNEEIANQINYKKKSPRLLNGNAYKHINYYKY